MEATCSPGRLARFVHDARQSVSEPSERSLSFPPPDVTPYEEPAEWKLVLELPETLTGNTVEPEQAPDEESWLRHQHGEETSSALAGKPSAPRMASFRNDHSTSFRSVSIIAQHRFHGLSEALSSQIRVFHRQRLGQRRSLSVAVLQGSGQG